MLLSVCAGSESELGEGTRREFARGAALLLPLALLLLPAPLLAGAATGNWPAAENAVGELVVDCIGVGTGEATPLTLVGAADLAVELAGAAVPAAEADGLCHAGMLRDLDGVTAENSVLGTGNLLLRLRWLRERER